MDNANIIDFVAYRNRRDIQRQAHENDFPEDLISAIQLLIQRLREDNPLKQIS